jgi:tRNA threonylcarbamoyladenosine biosynthesis protein TsaB
VIVLGFDTATPATAVALRLADGTTLRARDDPGAEERPGHTTRLLPLASELLGQAGLRWGAVQRIAVGVGPGTFTGLRVGVAMARGLAQSLGVEVVGISTLRTLAEAAFAEAPAGEVAPGEVAPGEAAFADVALAEPALVDRDSRAAKGAVLAAIDARRGEAFVAAYALGEGPPAATPPRARELASPRALAPEELGGFLAQAGAGRDWLAVGTGAIRFRVQMEAIGVVVAAEGSSLHRVDAGVLCELALTRPGGAAEAVLPDYRRRPDAEIALENAEP